MHVKSLDDVPEAHAHLLARTRALQAAMHLAWQPQLPPVDDAFRLTATIVLPSRSSLDLKAAALVGPDIRQHGVPADEKVGNIRVTYRAADGSYNERI